MQRSINTSRIASQIFSKAVSYNFCWGFAPLDPRKHTTMNHSAHNMYLDLWEYGQYPDWVHISSVPARTYETQVVNTVVATLNAKYGTNITAEFLLSKRDRSWTRFLSKDLKLRVDFSQVYPNLLGKLSSSLFVRESKFTWVVEQKARFDYTMSSFDSQIPETVGDFIDRYNEDIEVCVLASNLGFAPEIDQAPSALEKHERAEQQNAISGVQELQNLSEEHNNFLNRILAHLH